MSGAMTTIGNCTQISAFLRFAFPEKRGRAKKMAYVYDRSHRTTQKWDRGTAGPSADAVFDAAARHPKHRDLLIAWIFSWIRSAPSSAELIARVDALRAEIERVEAALAKSGGMNGFDARSGPECRAIVPGMGDTTDGGSGVADRARRPKPVADVR